MPAFLTHAEALDHLTVYQDVEQQDLAVIFIGGTDNKEAVCLCSFASHLA